MLPELETLTPPSPLGESVYMTTTYSSDYDKGSASAASATTLTPAQEAAQKAAGHPVIQGSEPIPTKSLQIRTDKPRPHVCLTCTRSFARLEHLKRHERSHTKERPFQCPICERCFARRDLLLRHRQKLHANFPESPKGKVSRRRSSVAQKQTPASSEAVVAQVTTKLATTVAPPPTTTSMSPPMSHHPQTLSYNLDIPTFSNPFDKASDLLMHPENHIDNDRELKGRRTRPASFSASCSASYLRDADIEMLKDKFPIDDHVQVEFSTPQLAPATLADPDYCIDEVLLSQGQSSFVNPRLLNHESPEEMGPKHEPLMNFFGDNDNMNNHHNNDDFDWMSQYVDNTGGVGHQSPGVAPPSLLTSAVQIPNSTSPMVPTTFAPSDMMLTPPNSMHFTQHQPHQQAHVQPQPQPQMHNPNLPNHPTPLDFSHDLDLDFLQPQVDTNDNSNNFIDFNQPQPTPPTYQGPTITPQIRLEILNILSTPTPYQTAFKLPNTADLQRYVVAFQDHFSKHLPFLHSTLEFNNENIPLALCMAAIGARYLFEFEMAQSIFEVSRCCVHSYLEKRRNKAKGDINGTNSDTPLWLIQALTLGVVYGLFSDDALVNDIAVAQASAVVSLARAAGLHLPAHNFFSLPGPDSSVNDKWRYFINVQSRIRTLHAIHALSCLVATGYNVCTSLKNSDIVCGSPCDESLWSSQCATEWWDIVKRKELDGSLKTTVGGPSYGQCLTSLIQGHTLVDKIPQFTLLSLMYGALLEISERRKVFNRNWHGSNEEKQRAWLNLQKKPIESFLRTWETTWSMSPLASLSPNSQYGPLMSDAIPLSSLAHVRTYVDLQPVKEAFAKKNFQLMGQELSNIDDGMSMDFHGLLEAASYSADSISLWEKHSVRWTMETLVSQTFIHALMAIFDCGLVVSEFCRRLELKPKTMWTEGEAQLWIRMSKILYRVCESVKDKDGSVDLALLAIENLPNSEIINPKQRLSLLTLHVVSKMLTSVYVWPYMKTMAEALRFRARQIR